MLIIVLMFISYFYLPELICKVLPQNSFTRYIGTIDEVLQAKIKMGLAILYLVVWSASIIIHTNKLTKNTHKLREANIKAELEVLKSQMNPHFFFNSLNAIYYLTMQKSNEAPKAIITLSDMMRYVLIDANADQVTLNQEQEYLNKYIAIQQLRLPEKTKLDFRFAIKDVSSTIAPLLFIPFVENAFKFGTSANHSTSIFIRLESIENKIYFHTQNRIFKNTKEKAGASTGLENIKKRLTILYPNKHLLQINNSGGKFLVTLEINLN